MGETAKVQLAAGGTPVMTADGTPIHPGAILWQCIDQGTYLTFSVIHVDSVSANAVQAWDGAGNVSGESSRARPLHVLFVNPHNALDQMGQKYPIGKEPHAH